MPITGRTPNECYGTFLEVIRPLVAATIGGYVRCTKMKPNETERMLELPEGVPLETRFGRLFFWMGQRLSVQSEKGRCSLETIWYAYRVQATTDARALIRWEYKKPAVDVRYARHHVQLQANVLLPRGESLDIDKLHVPTGWTPIEEVIRFLIHDLGVQPNCGDEWHELLLESERRFHSEI